MEKVIEGLEKLLNFLETDSAAADPKCGEAAEEVRLRHERLKEGDTDILGRLTYLCSPQGDVYRIVSAAGKEEELARLEADIDEAIGDFRLRKTEGGERLMATSYASSPGRLQISDYKWREIARAYRLGIRKKIKVQLIRSTVQDRLFYGDAQPAMVMSVSPFLVAAYSDEMDAVILLEFPKTLAEYNGLKQYDRLIAVNSYGAGSTVVPDIHIGKNYLGRWNDFDALIGDLLSDDSAKLRAHKDNVPEWLWQTVREMGEAYIRDYRKSARKGFWFIP